MAYALNLDPSENLSGRLPRSIFTDDHLTLAFYGGAPGVKYLMEWSDDLAAWDVIGVTVFPINEKKIVTAKGKRSGDAGFLRLPVSY